MTLNLTLETARLRMTPFGEADFDVFLDTMAQDPKVMQFYHAYREPMSPEERRLKARADFVNHFHESFQKHGYITWAIYPKIESLAPATELVGWCGIVAPVLKADHLGPEMAYMLASRFHRQGVAAEAGRAVLLDAFQRYNVSRIHAVMDAPNRASRRVAEKLGFRYLGYVTAYNSEDMVLYVLDRERTDSENYLSAPTSTNEAQK